MDKQLVKRHVYADEMKEVMPFDRSVCNAFFDTYKIQNFALPDRLILHILKTANARVLRKLFATCKFFFRHRPTPICHRLSFNNNETIFDKENVSLKISAINEAVLTGVYLTCKIDMCMNEGAVNETCVISNLIPHLAICDAKYIYLKNQILSFTDLKFLIGHGGVVEFCFDGELLKHDSDDFLELEDLMKFLPKIEKLKLTTIKVNENTSRYLSKQKFVGKICHFEIFIVRGTAFNADEFLKFFIANRDIHLYLRLGFFDKDFKRDFVEGIKKVFKDSEIVIHGTGII